jgi:hypothetical protein
MADQSPRVEQPGIGFSDITPPRELGAVRPSPETRSELLSGAGLTGSETGTARPSDEMGQWRKFYRPRALERRARGHCREPRRARWPPVRRDRRGATPARDAARNSAGTDAARPERVTAAGLQRRAECQIETPPERTTAAAGRRTEAGPAPGLTHTVRPERGSWRGPSADHGAPERRTAAGPRAGLKRRPSAGLRRRCGAEAPEPASVGARGEQASRPARRRAGRSGLPYLLLTLIP